MVKKLGLLLLIAMSCGCSIWQTPQMRNDSFGNQREVIYGYRGRVLHFLIVTDGTVSEFGDSNSLLGPSWAGFIQPVNKGAHVITFASGLYTMQINNQEYKLSTGQAFVITTRNNEPIIRQINIGVEDQVRSVVQTDPRFNF
ncbi:MAG: hypothetical protein ABFD69_09160 [Candidatus Sumerlaeia bacterium]